LTKNTTGTFNTAIGTAALQDPITGSNNTAIGDRALEQFGGASSSNTAVGCNALRGSFVLGSNASNNTAVGHNAGRFITTGGFNTILGSFDGNQNALDIRTTSNNIVLSDGAGNPRSYYDGTNDAWIWRTGASERMRIDSSGNVGIGTTSPGYALDVRRAVAGGTTYVAVDNTAAIATSLAGIYFSQNGTPKHSITAATFGADYMAFNVGSAGVITERIRIDSSGNVGIGTASPAVKLEVSGQIRTEAPTGGTAANWRLGTVHTVSPTSPNRTIEVDIGGTIYYLHAKTTNN
jgi:hypothetical protein